MLSGKLIKLGMHLKRALHDKPSTPNERVFIHTAPEGKKQSILLTSSIETIFWREISFLLVARENRPCFLPRETWAKDDWRHSLLCYYISLCAYLFICRQKVQIAVGFLCLQRVRAA